jgi:hypothetical protein
VAAKLAQLLEGEGVDISDYRAFTGTRSAVCAVLILPGGERLLFPFLGESLPDDSDWLEYFIAVARKAAGTGKTTLAKSARCKVRILLLWPSHMLCAEVKITFVALPSCVARNAASNWSSGYWWVTRRSRSSLRSSSSRMARFHEVHT